MPSIEYYEGRDMEINEYLHRYLTEKFDFTDTKSDGSSKTKIDIFGIKGNDKICFSVKNVSGKNTQVHLTTLKKFCEQLKIEMDISKKLEMWLGHNDDKVFESWCENKTLSNYELKHNRLKSQNIDDWDAVVSWVNKINKNQTLPRLLIQSLNVSEKLKYMIWVNKKTNIGKIVDIEKLINYISDDCIWIEQKSGTTLRCVTPQNKPILWLQMKGNRTVDGYNHTPQFHIVENWPEEFVIHEFEIE